ncbi:WxL domain-containing protein [Latilactobacillus sakei]|uniref:WxL domain-containing protein n=1 Tax=Latilactobacillus sakei TaxID=1599 RepID=A0AAF0GQ04_LATSK|nr:WxL domain-containing protein [Latilactobacillus sakei]WGI19026.1 WxL domain-containing protein [Latilactobacillus sakei]
MKFTKLTSSVLAGATLLSILAPTATFAATSTTGSNDAASNDNGGTKLPQTDKTVAGISFGDNSDNGNTGYLRLQMVPHTLDFGNHKILDDSKLDFTADGKNTSLPTNNLKASYEGGKTNQTAVLNTNDSDLSKVEGTAWATVVDKQVTRKDSQSNTANPNNTTDPTSDFYEGTTSKAGSWTLSVKSVDALTAMDNSDPSKPTAETITGAKLSFNNTQYGQTQKVAELTKDKQDATYTADLAKVTPAPTVAKVSSITNNFSTPLAAGGADIKVAEAKDGEGQGANVFGWTPENITLTMPSGAQVTNAIYKANLTWTLSSTVA